MLLCGVWGNNQQTLPFAPIAPHFSPPPPTFPPFFRVAKWELLPLS